MQLLTKIVSLHLILIKQPLPIFYGKHLWSTIWKSIKGIKFYSWICSPMGALHQGHLALMQQSLLADRILL
jgi:hypothetical protein